MLSSHEHNTSWQRIMNLPPPNRISKWWLTSNSYPLMLALAARRPRLLTTPHTNVWLVGNTKELFTVTSQMQDVQLCPINIQCLQCPHPTSTHSQPPPSPSFSIILQHLSPQPIPPTTPSHTPLSPLSQPWLQCLPHPPYTSTLLLPPSLPLLHYQSWAPRSVYSLILGGL